MVLSPVGYLTPVIPVVFLAGIYGLIIRFPLKICGNDEKIV
jgi:hypothetical protein